MAETIQAPPNHSISPQSPDSCHGHTPYIQGIKELVDAGLNRVPDNYIRPPHQRPDFSQVSEAEQLPVIDISALGCQCAARSQVIHEIRRACQDWGFFQVIHHGVPLPVVHRMRAAAREFFQQPAKERMRFFSEDINREVAYVTSFNRPHETIHEWKDSLRFRHIPGQFNSFKKAPACCREPALEYFKEVSSLAVRLYKAILESLELSVIDFEKAAALDISSISMPMHYYPSCPDPSLTVGLSDHSDINVLTILLQDEVGGLQVRKDDRWIAVKPIADAFVINMGDQIEILTNGKYRSVEHRVLTNSEKPRMSIACFFGPLEDATVAPLESLINEDNPRRYKETRYGDYVRNFFSKALVKKCSLDFARIPSEDDTNPRKVLLSE